MKKKFLPAALLAALLVGGVFFTSCSDDDDDDNTPGEKASVFSIENVTTLKDFVESGTIKGEGQTGSIIAPGESISLTFSAAKGQALMFAMMYGYSNDLFFAPENPGITLYSANGTPVTGDVSSQIKLWDNGTRVNVAPGPSIDHPGAAENGNVTMINGTDAQGNTYPAASSMMQLTLTYNKNASEFTLIIKNISNTTSNETPFSAGVWVVSNVLDGKLMNDKPFFIPGQKSSAELTKLAEEGDESALGDKVSDKTGIITTLSPTVVVIYTGDVNPIYQLNSLDPGNGLKSLAQTGNPDELKASLAKLPNVRNVYVAGTSTLAPGGKAEVQYSAFKGDHLAFATMFGYSNDWFFSNGSSITAISAGSQTSNTKLLNNGTAVTQYPGAGNAQAIFGGTPIPAAEVITEIGSTYPVPSISDLVKVTLR